MYWLGTAFDKTDEMGNFKLRGSAALVGRETAEPVISAAPRQLIRELWNPGARQVLTAQWNLLVYNGADDRLVTERESLFRPQ